MNVFVARSSAIELPQLDGHSQTLRALLVAAGHRVEILNLPSVDVSARTLTNLASYRLIESASSADVLICLDAVSAVLQHPRKLVLLLDDRHLDPRGDADGNDRMAERQYVANVLRASLKEAARLFVLSSFAAQKLGELSLEGVRVLPPVFSAPPFDYSLEPGSELLVLNPLDHRQRPELLIDCLAALPEPFRARWIAPYANASELARINTLARKAGVEQRLAIDVRQINEGEKAYVIAKAAALIELAPAMLAGSRDMHQALQTGGPVITCSDGGALTEDAGRYFLRSAEPQGASLATAVLDSTDRPPGQTPSSRTETAETAWAPLMEAVAQ